MIPFAWDTAIHPFSPVRLLMAFDPDALLLSASFRAWRQRAMGREEAVIGGTEVVRRRVGGEEFELRVRGPVKLREWFSQVWEALGPDRPEDLMLQEAVVAVEVRGRLYEAAALDGAERVELRFVKRRDVTYEERARSNLDLVSAYWLARRVASEFGLPQGAYADSFRRVRAFMVVADAAAGGASWRELGEKGVAELVARLVEEKPWLSYGRAVALVAREEPGRFAVVRKLLNRGGVYVAV